MLIVDKVMNIYGSKRDYTYDWVRIIATFFVVIGHSAYLAMPGSSGGVDWQLPINVNEIYYSFGFEFFRKAASWVYGFHMPLFFMLSGAVFSMKPINEFDKLFEAKFRRLVVPFFIYGCLVMLPIKWYGGFYDSISIKQAYIYFLNGNGDTGHLWFLQALFWCFVIFYLIINLTKKISNGKWAALFVSGIIYLVVPYCPIDFWCFKMGMSYIVFFALGYLFGMYKGLNNTYLSIKDEVVICLVCIVIEIVNFKYWILNTFFLNIIGSALTYTIADLIQKYFPNLHKGKIFQIVLRNCFFVYLIHDPINYLILKIFFSNDLLVHRWGCVLYLLSRTLFMFVGCIIIGEIVAFIKRRLQK